MQIRRRLHGRVHRTENGPGNGETEFVEIDTTELAGLFATPTWLRDLGITAWLLVGIAGMLVGAVWLLSLTQTIVTPVVTAAVLAAVSRRSCAGSSTVGCRAAPARCSCCCWSCWPVPESLFSSSAASPPRAARSSPSSRARVSEVEGWLKDLGVNSSNGARRHERRERLDQRRLPLPPRRARGRARSAGLARHLPLLHRAEPVLPAQGRPDDQALARGPPRRAAPARAHHQRPHDRLAARLLRRRHGGGGLQRAW